MIAQRTQAAEFRERLGAVLADTDPTGRLRGLAGLAHWELGHVETIQLDRALRQVAAEGWSDMPRARLALLSSCTADHLLPAIRVAGLRSGVLIELYAGPYGQYRQEVLDPNSGLHRFRPDMVVFALSAHEAIAGVPLTATATQAQAALQEFLDALRTLWHRTREVLGATVIQQSFLDTAEPLFGSYDRLLPGAPACLVSRLNDRLAEAAAEDGVLLLDIARASARDGLHAWFDVGYWLSAKMEIAPQAAPRYGAMLARLVAAQRGRSKKCLVLDLDNTLWGGVLGDDGVEGLVLGEGSPAGEAHLALQRYAKRLGQCGVILAVCSKNDPVLAEAAFREHPEMILRMEDIAAFIVNWDDKAANLRRIAAQLNIGLDSMVFVDDNPAERLRVRESLPMVAVPELPADPAGYVGSIAEAGYFESAGLTEADRERTATYAANARREAMREMAQTLEDFLRGLEMSVSAGRVSAVDLPRVTQLVNKTNQFNPTTRRYTQEEIAQICADPASLVLQFRLVDRFGDNGLVSAMLLRPAEGESDVLEIECWVMSCRVFGRQLEVEAMNIAVEHARDRGIRAFTAAYQPTAKNGIVSRLYEELGFAPMGPAAADGHRRWRLNLASWSPRTTFIARRMT